MRLCVRGVTLCALDVLRPLGPGLVLALVLVLAHSASTTPSEPGVMPAGVLLCNVLPLRLSLPMRVRVRVRVWLLLRHCCPVSCSR